jgi:hypothetical protein
MGSFTSYKANFPLSNMTPGVKATTLHFLCDLQMGPVSSSVRLHLPGKACHGQPLQLILSYKENKVLWIWSLVSKSQHFIFFATYKWAQQARVLDYTRLEILAMDKHYSLLGSFSIYKENEVLWIGPLGCKFTSVTARMFIRSLKLWMTSVIKFNSSIQQCILYTNAEKQLS